jgi:hypothetical protein
MTTFELAGMLETAELALEAAELELKGDVRRYPLMRALGAVRAARRELEASAGGAEAFERALWRDAGKDG